MFPFTNLFLLALVLQNKSLLTSSKQISRIIGGDDAHISQFPFIAFIQAQGPDSRWNCAGALYLNEHIVTAAQCVNGANEFTIQLGSASLNGSDSNRITLATSAHFIHPEYNPDTLENDIAIIKLRMPIKFTDYIKTLNFLGRDELGTNVTLHALGWGQTTDANAGLSNELQVAQVVPLTNDECKLVYGDQIKETMVCVEGNYNEGICHGDTGSPLIYIQDRGFNELVGIASFLSINGCESTDPSGYTRVFPYRQWITDTIKL